MLKVSVIIPIYKVEAFIEQCVTTLMQQTLCEIEYIFINDATPDSSIKILNEVISRYPERKEQVRIVNHETNKGLPAARNTGLALAKGEYIFHCDSDDYVEPTMLEEMFHTAKTQDADIVWCDWYLTFAENERYMKQPCFNTPMKALKAMLSGSMKFNVWNKLVRHSLYTDYKITFPAGYGMGEDMTMMMLFAHAQKVAYVPKAYYHYIKTNTNAFSLACSEQHMKDLKYNVQRIVDYMLGIYGNNIEKELSFFKLEAKFPFLISDDKSRYHLWKEWYPEANKYILDNKNVSTRSRWLQWAAWKGQWWMVWLHYQLVIKVVYGIIYK